MAYLLDSNVFIQAKNLHYGFDFCPAFWEWIDARAADGTVLSVDKVRDELVGGADELAAWAGARGDAFFLPADADTLVSMRTLTGWVNRAGYPPSAVNVFLQSADYYLVAEAHASGHVVVTHELPGATKRVKIPDAAVGLGVTCVV